MGNSRISFKTFRFHAVKKGLMHGRPNPRHLVHIMVKFDEENGLE
jgi:hypothetical protein